MFVITALPKELLQQITEYLNLEQTAYFTQTCRRIRSSLNFHVEILDGIADQTIYLDKKRLQIIYSRPDCAKYVRQVNNNNELLFDRVLRFPNVSIFFAVYSYYLAKIPCIENAVILDPQFDFQTNALYGFSMACFVGFDGIVAKMLQECDIDPSENGDEAIRIAALNGHLETVKLLLSDSRVDPTARGNCAIRWAVTKGHSDIVKLLLNDPRVDPSAGRNSALKRASKNRNFHIMKLLTRDHRVDLYSISFMDRMRVRIGQIVNKV